MTMYPFAFHQLSISGPPTREFRTTVSARPFFDVSRAETVQTVRAQGSPVTVPILHASPSGYAHRQWTCGPGSPPSHPDRSEPVTSWPSRWTFSSARHATSTTDAKTTFCTVWSAAASCCLVRVLEGRAAPKSSGIDYHTRIRPCTASRWSPALGERSGLSSGGSRLTGTRSCPAL